MGYKEKKKQYKTHKQSHSVSHCGRHLGDEEVRGAYNCHMLDFFFSGRAGFSFDALRETHDSL